MVDTNTALLPSFKIRNHLFDWTRPYIMGVLNVTPDSFSDGGKFVSASNAKKQMVAMIDAGADLIDIGAMSSRPGAQEISIDEEIDRLSPILHFIKKEFEIPVSLDAYRPEVISFGLEQGVDIINDITGLENPDVCRLVGRAGCPVIAMHKQGSVQTMQQNPDYHNVVEAVLQYFKTILKRAESFGISSLILDPGIGFGKTVDHNLQLLNQLDGFQTLMKPILIGTSRKSFIGTLAKEPDPLKREPGSLASHLWAVSKGANIVRVHDVSQMKQALTIWQSIEGCR